MRVAIEQRTLRLRTPLQTSYGPPLAVRELLELEIEGADGVPGCGEAAPLEPYDGVSLERARAALEAYRPLLEDGDGLDGGELLDACRAADDLPQALAAVDLALWDRAGRRARHARRGAAERLRARRGARQRDDRRAGSCGRRRERRAARAAGFGCVKLKVGTGDDAGASRRCAPRSGRGSLLRLDANGAWTVDEAVRAIASLSAAGLELVEEPVHGLAALREVRERVAVRIAMDETAAEPGSLTSGAADAVCLKLGRCGGISGLLASRDARARVGRRAVRRVDARRAARDRGRAARRRRAAAARRVRARDARPLRGRRAPVRRARRRHRGAARSRPHGRSAP